MSELFFNLNVLLPCKQWLWLRNCVFERRRNDIKDRPTTAQWLAGMDVPEPDDAQGLAFKVQVLPAAKLTPAQSKAVAVTVPTVNWRRPEVTVGQVALYGDFLSERLMLMCENGRPLHIAAGTLVDVTKMIGCCIEHQRLNVKNNK